MSDEYVDKWKQEIYQKTGRENFSFWYGTDSMKGEKGRDGRRRKKG